MKKSHSRSLARRALLGTSVIALTTCWVAASSQSAGVDATADRQPTASPIKHLIVLIGENRGFDHTFATYTPRSGETIKNLLSQGIVNADGSPGPNFAKGHQFKIVSAPNGGKFFSSANMVNKQLYTTLPAPDVNGVGPVSPYIGI